MERRLSLTHSAPSQTADGIVKQPTYKASRNITSIAEGDSRTRGAIGSRQGRSPRAAALPEEGAMSTRATSAETDPTAPPAVPHSPAQQSRSGGASRAPLLAAATPASPTMAASWQRQPPLAVAPPSHAVELVRNFEASFKSACRCTSKRRARVDVSRSEAPLPAAGRGCVAAR